MLACIILVNIVFGSASYSVDEKYLRHYNEQLKNFSGPLWQVYIYKLAEPQTSFAAAG